MKRIIFLLIGVLIIVSGFGQDLTDKRIRENLIVYGTTQVLGDSLTVSYAVIDSVKINGIVVKNVTGEILADTNWVKNEITSASIKLVPGAGLNLVNDTLIFQYFADYAASVDTAAYKESGVYKDFMDVQGVADKRGFWRLLKDGAIDANEGITEGMYYDNTYADKYIYNLELKSTTNTVILSLKPEEFKVSLNDSYIEMLDDSITLRVNDVGALKYGLTIGKDGKLEYLEHVVTTDFSNNQIPSKSWVTGHIAAGSPRAGYGINIINSDSIELDLDATFPVGSSLDWTLDDSIHLTADKVLVSGKFIKSYSIHDLDTTIYVSKNTGSDSNIGTEAFPFKTITGAINTMPDIFIKSTRIFIKLTGGAATYNISDFYGTLKDVKSNIIIVGQFQTIDALLNPVIDVTNPWKTDFTNALIDTSDLEHKFLKISPDGLIVNPFIPVYTNSSNYVLTPQLKQSNIDAYGVDIVQVIDTLVMDTRLKHVNDVIFNSLYIKILNESFSQYYIDCNRTNFNSNYIDAVPDEASNITTTMNYVSSNGVSIAYNQFHFTCSYTAGDHIQFDNSLDPRIVSNVFINHDIKCQGIDIRDSYGVSLSGNMFHGMHGAAIKMEGSSVEVGDQYCVKSDAVLLNQETTFGFLSGWDTYPEFWVDSVDYIWYESSIVNDGRYIHIPTAVVKEVNKGLLHDTIYPFVNNYINPETNQHVVIGGSWVNNVVNNFTVTDSLNVLDTARFQKSIYVDGHLFDGTFPAYTFENGLTETSGTVKLGGTLTGATNIDGAQPLNYGSTTALSGFGLYTDGSLILNNSTAGVLSSTLELGLGTLKLESESSTNVQQLFFTASSMLVTDTRNSKGLIYAADYSTNYTDRSIPDANWVADTIANSISGAIGGNNNELLMSDGVGGTKTDVDLNWNGLYFNLSGGTQNTLIGALAGSSTTGASNTFLGHNAGYANIGGYTNTFIGAFAGVSNISGHDNVSIGSSAGQLNSTGDYNICIGRDAGWSNTSGDKNVFIGYQAGYNETGSNKLYLDNSNADAANALIYGEFDNNMLRVNGRLEIDDGNNNIFIGANSGISITTGSNNVSTGFESGNDITTGQNNVYYGKWSGRDNNSTDNSFYGYRSGIQNTGLQNVFIGSDAGLNNVNGLGNILLGFQAGYNETGSNQLYIENSNANKYNALIWGDFANDSLRFNANVKIKDELWVRDTSFYDFVKEHGGTASKGISGIINYSDGSGDWTASSLSLGANTITNSTGAVGIENMQILSSTLQTVGSTNLNILTSNADINITAGSSKNVLITADTLEVTGVIKGVMQVARAGVVYTNTSQTTIITLPADAVVWNISLEIITLFNGTGTDKLAVGTTSTSNKYITGDDLSNAIEFRDIYWGSMSTNTSDTPDRMSASTNITFQYTDQNSDATQGQAFVYIHYTVY